MKDRETTASLRVVLGLLGLSVLALIVTGAPIYSRLSYLWGLLLAGSWAWSRLALRGVELQRMTRARRAQVGQVFQEQFEIHNSGRLPRLWLEVRDRSALPGSRASRVVATIKGRQRRPYSVRTRLVRRGMFPLGPTVLAAGDPFGLFAVSRTLLPDASLLVYPITVDVRAFPSPPGLLPGGEALRRLTHQVTPNAASVRKYAPGDSMNRIHWASTARRDTLMVKEFELDPLAEVWIFVDAARKVQAALPPTTSDQPTGTLWQDWAAELPPATEEYAVSIAASLGQYFLRRGRAVGLVSWDRSLKVLSPDRGGRQLGKILEALALLRAEGDLSISALVTAESRHMPRGSTVILVTPSVQEEVAMAADIVLRRGLRPVVVLLDAASFGGPPGTAALATAIRALSVPVCQVENGADLGAALSMRGD
ncbi:MAG: DUF58 domain-containing protein [Chloroflexi bacterium]|nr:DUF58 domain-containing protein [Chloroflexota bacterium]